VVKPFHWGAFVTSKSLGSSKSREKYVRAPQNCWIGCSLLFIAHPDEVSSWCTEVSISRCEITGAAVLQHVGRRQRNVHIMVLARTSVENLGERRRAVAAPKAGHREHLEGATGVAVSNSREYFAAPPQARVPVVRHGSMSGGPKLENKR